MSVFNGAFFENDKEGKLTLLECRKCGYKVITSDKYAHSALDGECADSVLIEGGGGLREFKAKKSQDGDKAYFRNPAFYKPIGIDPVVDVYSLLKNHPSIYAREENGCVIVARYVGDEVLKFVHCGGFGDFTLSEYLSKLFPEGDLKEGLVKLV